MITLCYQVVSVRLLLSFRMASIYAPPPSEVPMSDSAAVILAANCKGGCGKSTTILILAGGYAAQGYQVHVIDADPKKRLVKWAATNAKPKAITVSEANSATIRGEIE